MAGRVEQLDCRRWAETFLARFARYIRRDRQNHAGQAARRGGARAHRSAIRPGAPPDAPARLRRHPARAGEPSGPRGSDERDRGAARRSRGAPRDRRPRRQRPAGRTRSSSGSATCPFYLCAEHGYLARAPGGRWERQLEVDLSWLPRIERLLRTRHRRRSRDARRAEELQRHLALPPGRARVRRLAGPRAARRDRADAPRRSCRDPARAPGDRGARARRQQGRLRARPVPGRQGRLRTSCSRPGTTAPTWISTRRCRPARSACTWDALQQRARDVSRRDQFFVDSPRAVRNLLRALVEATERGGPAAAGRGRRPEPAHASRVRPAHADEARGVAAGVRGAAARPRRARRCGARSSNSSRRCVRIISGPSVAIVNATPFSTNARNVSRTASSSGSAFVSRFEVGQISSTMPGSRAARASAPGRRRRGCRGRSGPGAATRRPRGSPRRRSRPPRRRGS